ncbi:hemerythrin domain-containing protein [Ramlibacter sp. B156]|uniref:Hemerythrin domain-containing protein n=1 Tax=Ramlibacter montanisoli TaxID=2732512 RepID=A0A849KGJ7_9BURK|nr:hemerythrin domain-containing protein [Ramlibacter montanisoli]
MAYTDASDPVHHIDGSLADFSECHHDFVAQLHSALYLPELVTAAAKARAMAKDLLKMFRDGVTVHHAEEERELFPAVLRAAHPGPELDEVRAMVAQLVREHRDMEARVGTEAGGGGRGQRPVCRARRPADRGHGAALLRARAFRGRTLPAPGAEDPGTRERSDGDAGAVAAREPAGGCHGLGLHLFAPCPRTSRELSRYAGARSNGLPARQHSGNPFPHSEGGYRRFAP